MIEKAEYENALIQIGPRFGNVNINWHSWYMQYVYYESMWNNYFQIFTTQFSNPNKSIHFVFWESCPGGMPFPHQNYAFDSNRFNNPIDGTFDSYLKNVCDCFKIAWKNKNKNRKIGDIFTDLTQNGILIIDLYPTHGISLDTTNRRNLFNNLLPSYSMPKLRRIRTNTAAFLKNDNNIKVARVLWNTGINNNMTPALNNDIKVALGISSPLPLNFFP